MTEKQTETWVYLGQRLTGAGKVSHVWRDGDGRDLWFPKLKASVVGGIYTLDVERKPEGGMSAYQNTMAYQGQAEDAANIQVDSRAAAFAIERTRLEKNAGRLDALDEAAQPLLAIAAKTRSHAGKAALVDYITRRIYTS